MKARESLLEFVLDNCVVYARLSPEEKGDLIENLQEHYKEHIAMCGDGANDCSALKTADIGISLSNAEASIAAPFTSQEQNISCVIKLLCEGRGALSTSFQVFKFMTLYSMIQFATVTILYYYSNNLSDPMFLFIDLFTLFPLTILMGLTGSCNTLNIEKPPSSLISFPVLFSVLGQIFIQTAFQIGMAFVLISQPWFVLGLVENEPDPDLAEESMITTVRQVCLIPLDYFLVFKYPDNGHMCCF
jgi:cation-transporting ATPase 13A2